MSDEEPTYYGDMTPHEKLVVCDDLLDLRNRMAHRTPEQAINLGLLLIVLGMLGVTEHSNGARTPGKMLDDIVNCIIASHLSFTAWDLNNETKGA